MNIPIITQLVSLIEEILKVHGPEMAKVAEQAAVGAAVATVETDPKVQAATQASLALLAAAQTLRRAIQEAPAAPSIVSESAPTPATEPPPANG